jgi:two-component system, chemotaxis family, protein-glutamate methylesterase/glutaminase
VPHHDVIVVGASFGGVQALSTLLAGLPADLPAAIFIVLHVRPDAPSQLPAILNRAGTLPVAHAVDDEPIRRGRVYVAPPGFQTYVHHGRIGVRRGPQENLHRPAIDPLFRTAAHHYGPRVIGVVLTGALDDGSMGLAAVKQAGGIAIVQDPNDAVMRHMPDNALTHVDADYCVPVAELAALLVELVGRHSPAEIAGEVPLETVEEAQPSEPFRRSEEMGRLSNVTCPDCHGNLWEIEDHGNVRFRCRVGHAYSAVSLEAAQTESVERALWSALRALEERSALMRKLAAQARRRGNETVAVMFDDRSEHVESDVRSIHDLIVNGRTLEPVGQEGI